MTFYVRQLISQRIDNINLVKYIKIPYSTKTYMKGMSNETKLILGVIAATVVLIGGALFFFSKQETAQTNTPTIPREELVTQGSYTKGNASASAYLVEFSDFQCPACKAFAPYVEQIIENNKENISLTYRNYPLPQHEFAEKAAFAAEAAGRQGKFWEFHDKLFQNQDKLSDQLLVDLAKELQLDETKFNQDRQSNEVKDKINKDKAAGNLFGVNATPTFYLNGKKLTLRSAQDLETQVKSALGK